MTADALSGSRGGLVLGSRRLGQAHAITLVEEVD